MTLFLRSKEVFRNENATPLDLVEKLYMLPQKPLVTMRQFAVWLEECVTKLVAADEAMSTFELRWETSAVLRKLVRD